VTGFYPCVTLTSILSNPGCFVLGAYTVCANAGGRIYFVQPTGRSVVYTDTLVPGPALNGSYADGITILSTGVTPGTWPQNVTGGQLVEFTVEASGQLTFAANGALPSCR